MSCIYYIYILYVIYVSLYHANTSGYMMCYDIHISCDTYMMLSCTIYNIVSMYDMIHVIYMIFQIMYDISNYVNYVSFLRVRAVYMI